MKRLIVNADGFGFAFGANRGIFEAVRDGLVTSVSCNTNFPGIEELPALVQQFPHVSPGVHFNLNVGRPILPPEEIPSLVNADGAFWGPKLVGRLMTGRVRMAEMVRELDAQVRRMRELGVEPTHWDGHQHRHLYPPYLLAAIRVARRHGIRRARSPRRWLVWEDGTRQWSRMVCYYLRKPQRLFTHTSGRILYRYVRWRGFITTDRQVTSLHLDRTGNYRPECWRAVMEKLPPGTSELVCHPAYPDETLQKHATYVEQRRQELEILTSPELRRAAEENGVELISFHNL